MKTITILVADNDPVYLDNCSEYLAARGYDILTATNPTEARQALLERRVHLAILDLRLLNDENEDRSGLQVAQDTARTIPKLINTKFPVHQDVVAALKLDRSGLPPAVDFIRKQDELPELLKAVREALQNHVLINWDLVIHWNAVDRFALVSIIDQDVLDSKIPERASELEDLFGKLFYTPSQVRIERLLWQRAGRLALITIAFNDRGDPSAQLVILGRPEYIRQEIDRYQEFAPKAPGDTGTSQISDAETTHFAACTYALAGASLEDCLTLDELYHAGEEGNFNTCLATLYQKTLAEWHQDRQVSQIESSLSMVYRDWLDNTTGGLPHEGFYRRVQAVLRQAPMLGTGVQPDANGLRLVFGRQEQTYPDPLQLLIQPDYTRFSVMLIRSPGRISINSVLTAADGRAWLTDFGEAGYAPQLWSYVQLEAEMRFDWLGTRNLPQQIAIERALLSGDFIHPDLSDVDSPLRKPLRHILALRRLAQRWSGGNHSDYHLAVYFCAAQRLAEFNPGTPLLPGELARLTRMIISMAMTVALLAEEPPRREIDLESDSGILIDTEIHRVTVAGRPVEIAPQDFELLCYLHDRRDQLCRREDVFRHIYGREYSEAEDYLLNTAISRLREKIEPDREHPSYLVTRRGVGYILRSAPGST